MTFTARYRGHCNADDCDYGDNEIRPGDDVTYLDDQLVHAACVDRQSTRADTPLCPACWQYHRGECL